MAENENRPDRDNEERKSFQEPTDEIQPPATDEYELTAKDAGWRTPTLLISPAAFVYFDPPRPRKRP
jgi:hypothetical protein